MGTAPLKPTHETKALSRLVILLNGIKHRYTLSGRATIIIKKEIINLELKHQHSTTLEFTKRPSVKNNNI